MIISSGASGNIIGGLPLERNVIAGNGLCNGVNLEGASNNKVMRNLIGVNSQGSSLGIGVGIYIRGNSDNNVIGGSGVGEGNVIAFTSEKAIWNTSDLATGNSFLGNNIFDNPFGIDLGNHSVTPNDSGDPDTGANNLQNFPLITSAIPNGASGQVSGTLNSVANGQYRIELFANPTCNSTGNGEGKSSRDARHTAHNFRSAFNAGEVITQISDDPLKQFRLLSSRHFGEHLFSVC